MSGRPLRVLVAHNAYQLRGGEDAVVEAEVALLRGNGHEVIEYHRHNDEIKDAGKLSVVAQTMWSSRTTADVTRLVEQSGADVIHVHNTFPLISSSLYWAADRLGVPLVQTLHNFRLFCPQAMFLRDGKVCEDCLGRVPWPGVVHGCYRGSRAQTAVLATAQTLHRGIGSFRHKVTSYIALNEFCRSKFIQGGLPAERIFIKPNFLQADEPPPALPRAGGLYVGRMSQEKGLDVLAGAAAQASEVPLQVVGDGDLADFARQAFGAAFLGPRKLPQILDLMRRSAFLVVPSIWYENFPRTIVEAYASGLPVIASRLGALPEIVEDGRTGLLFEPGHPADLAAKLKWAHAHPQEMLAMGAAARAAFEQHYTPTRNYAQLLDIYRHAQAAKAGTPAPAKTGT